MVRKAPVTRDTWLEYAQGCHCGLCGNSGLLTMRGIKTPTGVDVAPVEKHPCICPNGRAIKYAKRKKP